MIHRWYTKQLCLIESC